jgi:hypothetical protein
MLSDSFTKICVVRSMPGGDGMEVHFIGSVAVITPDPFTSHGLYVEVLGLPLATGPDGYLHSEAVDGSRSFGVWPLTQAAQACFGAPEWPADRPVPKRALTSRSWTLTTCRPLPRN